VDTVELEKQLLGDLRDLRTVLTGEVLDQACALARAALTDRADRTDRDRAGSTGPGLVQGGSASGLRGTGAGATKRKQMDLTRIRTILKGR
jgi:hypothetical protein